MSENRTNRAAKVDLLKEVVMLYIIEYPMSILNKRNQTENCHNNSYDLKGITCNYRNVFICLVCLPFNLVFNEEDCKPLLYPSLSPCC